MPSCRWCSMIVRVFHGDLAIQAKTPLIFLWFELPQPSRIRHGFNYPDDLKICYYQAYFDKITLPVTYLWTCVHICLHEYYWEFYSSSSTAAPAVSADFFVGTKNNMVGSCEHVLSSVIKKGRYSALTLSKSFLNLKARIVSSTIACDLCC